MKELQGQALLIDQKFERAEKAGKVGEKLPADLVGNAEATSETFWKDLGTFKIQTYFFQQTQTVNTNFFFQLLFLKTTIIFFSNDQYIHKYFVLLFLYFFLFLIQVR